MKPAERVVIEQEPPQSERKRPAPGWVLLAVGAVLGAAVATLVGVSDGETVETTPERTVETGDTTTTIISDTTVPVPDADSVGAAPLIPEGLIDGKLLVLTGEWPELTLEAWGTDQSEVLVQLPWFASGLATDASGTLFAFGGPSATGQTLFIGRGDGYVALSTQVNGGWAWHTTEPGTLAWIDIVDEEPVVKVSRLTVEVVGDRGEFLDVSQDTSQLVTARPDERLFAFTQAGVVLGVLNPTSAASTARLVSLNGEVTAEAEGLLAVAFTADGYGLMASRVDDGIVEHKIVNADFEVVADLGSHQRLAEWATWSPDGQAVAFIDTRGTIGFRGGDFESYLEVWTREGERLLEVPLRLSVYDTTWTPDGSHVVVISVDDAWGGLLFVDAGSGELVALQADRDTIFDVEATN